MLGEEEEAGHEQSHASWPLGSAVALNNKKGRRGTVDFSSGLRI